MADGRRVVNVYVPLAPKKFYSLMPKGLFISTKSEDAKGFLEEPKNLKDTVKRPNVIYDSGFSWII